MKKETSTSHRVSRRRFLRDATFTSLGIWAAACAPGTQPGAATPAPAAKKGGEFHGAWPYDLPPKGHYNYFAAGAILRGGIYTDLMYPSLAVYRWADAKWDFWMAESAKLTGNVYEVKLRKNIKWATGEAFSAKDVLATYNIGRMEGFGIWNFVDKIEAVDDSTVRFNYSKPSSLGERLIMRNGILPDSVFGAIAKKAADLYAAGKTTASDEIKALRKELSDLRPSAPPSSGPYKVDPASVTEAQLTMVRNPGGLFADKVTFDKIVVYQGETAQVTPLVLAGDVDYATHGFPLATDKAFTEQGFKIVRGPLFTGPALYFHWESAAAFQDKRLRQAVAHAINRSESGKIAYGESAAAPKYNVGYSDSLVPNWISEADRAKLNAYPFDLAKAESLMKAAGYAKGGDGIWAKDGKKLEFEMYFPSDFADWSSAATHAADALNKFGIKITPRGAPRSQQGPDLNNGKFQIGFNPWGIGNPHPQASITRPIREFNITPAGGGMKYPTKHKTDVVGEVDFVALLDESGVGFDTNAQKAAVTKMSLAFNELLPIVPLWERFANNPINEKARVTGYPALGDKIYQQGGGDNFTIVLLMDGTLRSK